MCFGQLYSFVCSLRKKEKRTSALVKTKTERLPNSKFNSFTFLNFSGRRGHYTANSVTDIEV